jgi:putative transposase
MPDHVHLLIELDSEMTIEKAMQFIKGRFSHRLKQEFGHRNEVWQRGYSEKQVMDAESMDKCHEYIAMNPVKAGLAQSANEYPFCFRFLAAQKAGLADRAEDVQGLKPT